MVFLTAEALSGSKITWNDDGVNFEQLGFDAYCLRQSARLDLKVSPLPPKNHSPNGFFNGGSPLGLESLSYPQTKNSTLMVLFLFVGWVMGFEPTAFRATTWRSNQLSYTHQIFICKKVARLERLELPTYCLEGSCSIRLSYKRIEKNGAGDGNRTHATSLEGWNSTIELHSQIFCWLFASI